MLTLLIVLWLGFSVFRSCRIGFLTALPGNLRLAAFLAMALGFGGLVFGAMWSFGIRNRKMAAIVLVIGLIAFASLQLI